MRKDNLVALLHALAGGASLITSFYTKGGIPIPEEPVKTAGFIVFGLGMLLFAYAIIYLRDAFRGNIQPITKDLITTGPYQVVRHPLYLAMLTSCLGLAFGMRSIAGLACVVFLFLPLCIYRAKLEERALYARFGEQWQDYVQRTRFMLPFIY
jgi:protein-S-isoprenylcysteine O-methyltransferase Ste14